MAGENADPFLEPTAGGSDGERDERTGIDRRRLLAGTATVAAGASAGCLGGEDDGPGTEPTVFVFNTGDGTVSLIDPAADEVVGTRSLGLTSSFPSNQYTPDLVDDPADSLWLNVDRGVRGLSSGELSETARVETGSGRNWLERTPGGDHVVVSAREPAHAQFRIDADPDSESFGDVTGELDRTDEGGVGDAEGPGPCDVTVHPDGEYAYVPDLFGDTLTVVSVDPFEIAGQVVVEPVGDGPARPWMATVSPDGEVMLVEHDEGETGTESVWDTTDPADPTPVHRIAAEDDLGERPLTSEIGPDSETGYVFTPGSNDVTVVDLGAGTVTDRIDLGGEAFVGTWDPGREKLYVPVQTDDEVAVIAQEDRAVVDRISVGAAPYGATAARVRPGSQTGAALSVALARVAGDGPDATTYCMGNCACGHDP